MSTDRGSPDAAWTLVFACWLVATAATLGALFFSEVMQLPPCALCWYQRIFIFPLVLLLPMGLFPWDRRVIRYALPLLLVGTLFSLFQLLLVWGVIPGEHPALPAGRVVQGRADRMAGLPVDSATIFCRFSGDERVVDRRAFQELEMNRKIVFIVSVVVLLLVFAGGALLYKSEKVQRWGKLIGQNQAVLASRIRRRSARETAKVHIVEFLDPACETCAAFYPQVKKMMAANPDRIRLSVRHLPLHNGSLEVVKILEASRKQGKYWPTLEAVLANQSRWVSNHTARPEMVWEVLGGVGLNLEQLRADMNSPDVARNLEQDRSDAKALNVTMTPEYFVNGRPLPDFGLAQLQALVRDALQTAYR